MKKIIFLDIDGVLCTNRSCVKQRSYLMQRLDPVATEMLDYLLEESGAELVLSSSWRSFHDKGSMTAILENAGLLRVNWHQCWKTPDRVGLTSRGHEIKQWMSENGEPEKYLILDDNTDMLTEQKPFFVKTDTRDGFLFQHLIDALKIFGLEYKK